MVQIVTLHIFTNSGTKVYKEITFITLCWLVRAKNISETSAPGCHHHQPPRCCRDAHSTVCVLHKETRGSFPAMVPQAMTPLRGSNLLQRRERSGSRCVFKAVNEPTHFEHCLEWLTVVPQTRHVSGCVIIRDDILCRFVGANLSETNPLFFYKLDLQYHFPNTFHEHQPFL